MTDSIDKQRRAEERFHQAIKKTQEAKQPVSQYEATARAVDEKTARLRALRLAKEAAEVMAPSKNSSVVRKDGKRSDPEKGLD